MPGRPPGPGFRAGLRRRADARRQPERLTPRLHASGCRAPGMTLAVTLCRHAKNVKPGRVHTLRKRGQDGMPPGRRMVSMRCWTGAVSIAGLLSAASSLWAQTEPLVYGTSTCVKVVPGKAAEFERFVAEVTRKLMQVSIDEGRVVRWSMSRAVAPSGQEARCDYVALSVYKGTPPPPRPAPATRASARRSDESTRVSPQSGLRGPGPGSTGRLPAAGLGVSRTRRMAAAGRAGLGLRLSYAALALSGRGSADERRGHSHAAPGQRGAGDAGRDQSRNK